MKVPNEILEQINKVTGVPYPDVQISFFPRIPLTLAITFRKRIFKFGTNSITYGHLAHELFHVYQYQALGVLGFLFSYAWQLRLRWSSRPIEVGAINSAYIVYAQEWGPQIAIYRNTGGTS